MANIGLLVAAILLAQLAGGIFGSAFAQTFEQELARLFGEHPTIKAARRDQDRAEGQRREAFADFLPRLTFEGDVGYQYTDSPARRSARLDALNADRGKATLSATQNVFDGNRRFAAYDAAKIGQEIAAANLSVTAQDLLFDGISVYHNVLRNSRLIELGFASENTVKRQLDLEDERVRRGAGIAIDVLFSKSRLQIAKEQRVSFEGRLRNSSARYEQLFGRAPEVGSMIEPAPPADLLPGSLDAAIDLALQDSPQLGVSARNVDVADRQRDMARSELFPRLDLIGKLNVEDDVDGVVGTRKEGTIVLQLSWDLFTGFGRSARISQASARYLATIDNLSSTQRQIVEEVRLAWNDLETARMRVELLENAVNIAAEVFETRERLRAAGQEEAINVLDAETELNSARINLTNATFDARLSIYRILRSIGRLTPTALGFSVVAEN